MFVLDSGLRNELHHRDHALACIPTRCSEQAKGSLGLWRLAVANVSANMFHGQCHAPGMRSCRTLHRAKAKMLNQFGSAIEERESMLTAEQIIVLVKALQPTSVDQVFDVPRVTTIEAFSWLSPDQQSPCCRTCVIVSEHINYMYLRGTCRLKRPAEIQPPAEQRNCVSDAIVPCLV
jgi:hypothetical protein